MRVVKRVSVLFVTFGICLWVGLGNAETVDKIVANVNGEIILYSELKDRVQQMQKAGLEVTGADASQQAEIERQILKAMVYERLAEQEMKRLKINVATKDVDAAIDGIKRENRVTDIQFEQALKQQGQTLDQFRETIKKQMERGRLLDRTVKSKIIVSDAQVDALLKSGQGSAKEKRRVAVIFLPSTADQTDKGAATEKLANDLIARIKAGEDFGRLAREYSKGPAAENGGDIGFVDAAELAKPMEAATRNLGPGDTTGVVKVPTGFYILKLVDVQKERLDPSDPSVREKARKFLMNQEMERKYTEWVQELEKKAFIQISL
ncbi:MAG: peptidylprolyl isomerase [Syntrophobacteraceae bacterium]